MQYVNFGTTGLQISRLGFGGIPIQRIDQPGTRKLLIAAHKAGINYIDTARAYTVSEAWIGQSLEEAGLPVQPADPPDDAEGCGGFWGVRVDKTRRRGGFHIRPWGLSQPQAARAHIECAPTGSTE